MFLYLETTYTLNLSRIQTGDLLGWDAKSSFVFLIYINLVSLKHSLVLLHPSRPSSVYVYAQIYLGVSPAPLPLSE